MLILCQRMLDFQLKKQHYAFSVSSLCSSKNSLNALIARGI